ncbi:vitelline membrane outer layer protein 1-like [Protopterus annectens]|uniref:vitelline membrane outer layer protein 1-like n=1 Tax=Protopterus annectens TaxID=7888 RepID=UPI001CFADAB2|nr:vitelline membrane outer layer protein 1-like [Protopterus annectens]
MVKEGKGDKIKHLLASNIPSEVTRMMKTNRNQPVEKSIVRMKHIAYSQHTVKSNGLFTGRKYTSILTVTNGGEWGNWTWIDMCPEGSYATGFSLKVEEYRGASDDTALNGIRLFCSTAEGSKYTVESNVGRYGTWTQITWCPRGALTKFQLKVEPSQGVLDDTAANNVKFYCNNGAIIEGAGMDFGEYGGWSNECKNSAICGIITKQELYQGVVIDDTSLNDVQFFCCE